MGLPLTVVPGSRISTSVGIVAALLPVGLFATCPLPTVRAELDAGVGVVVAVAGESASDRLRLPLVGPPSDEASSDALRLLPAADVTSKKSRLIGKFISIRLRM
jgi:hypothetical protein